jgi:hypothetical protein
VQGALVDVHSDNGLIHHVAPGSLVLAHRHKCQPCGNQRQSTALSAIIGRADGVGAHSISGSVDLGVRDANTVVVSNPLLNASYLPVQGSLAIGRAADGLTPIDLLFRRRTTATIGALEAA